MKSAFPESLGFNSSRLQRIDTAMNRFVDEGRIAGVATMLLRKGQIVQQKGYGMASIELNHPMQTDTLFRIWSMTKAITIVTALTLYEQGLFLLDQDITEYLPEFKDTPVYVSGEGDSMIVEPRKGPMTIRQVMSHSAGLTHGIGSHYVETLMSQQTGRIFEESSNLAHAIKRISEIPLIAQPGTRWNYSHGLELIARLVEVVSGQRYDVYLRENVLKPLGMVDTGYVVPDEKFDRFSAFYGWDGKGGFTLREAPSDSPEYKFRANEPLNNWWSAGGFGLVSTPQDCARFAQMLLNGGILDGVRVLAPRTVALMTANHLPALLIPYHFPDAPLMHGYGHGLGVHVLMDHGLAALPCKNGEFWKDGGAGTLFWVDPALELVGIAMYQLFEFPRVPVFGTFRATAYQALEDI